MRKEGQQQLRLLQTGWLWAGRPWCCVLWRSVCRCTHQQMVQVTMISLLAKMDRGARSGFCSQGNAIVSTSCGLC
jgi:hypothetical protein